MTWRFAIAALFLSTALSGCDKNSKTDNGDNVGVSDGVSASQVETAASPAASLTPYSCDNGKTVLARYVSLSPGSAGAQIEVGKDRYALHEVVAASGAKYEAASAQKGGARFIWWTKGDEDALWLEARDGSNTETIVATCKAPRSTGPSTEAKAQGSGK